MTIHLDRPPLQDDAVLLLPERPARLGPVSRRLLLRLAVVLALVQGVGAWLTFGVGSATARAAGLSLVFPGAGFVYVAWPLLFLLTAALLVLGLVLWWGASFHAAIPIVWLASAGLAAALADGPRLVVDRGTTWDLAVPFAYLCAVTAVGWAVWSFERRYRRKRALVPDINAYLASAELPVVEPYVRPSDAVDAELVRWCYDLAFQPDDGLKGLDWGEQLHGGTQLRYQLNTFCWALGVFAANSVPNAPTQVERALGKLIEKHTDLRVWGYWRTLNVLGNLDANPDPIVRDNIMFSAFLGDVLNIYEAVTGSDRFDRPGSLTFVWKDGRTFPYDHHSIAEAVRRNFDRSRLGFFPCEPGWSFTVCNIMGAQSLLGHDVHHGTDAWEQVRPAWQRALEEEYLTPDGSYAHIRSNHVGLSWDTGEVPGGHYFANGSNRFVDILPAHARRARALELRSGADKLRALAGLVTDGQLALELPEAPERHRTRTTALPAWTGIVGGARMLGERDLAEAALTAAARQCGTGLRWPDRPLKAGAAGLAAHMLVRWSTPLTTADLNVRGYVRPIGPVLADTAWDDVLVLVARSTDGTSLELELEPWNDTALDGLTLSFTGLAPGTTYTLGEGPTVVADAGGTGTATIRLDARTSLVLTPIGAQP